MQKKEYNLDIVDKNTLLIYLHGYKGDKNEFIFLRDWVTNKLKMSFLSITYGKRGKDNQILTLIGIINEINSKLHKGLEHNYFSKIFLYGYSLGAAIAVKLVTESDIKFSGLILHAVFDDRLQLLKERGIAIPEEDNICPINIVSNISIPIGFIHGSLDQSIKLERSYNTYLRSNIKENMFISLPIEHMLNEDSEKKVCNALEFIINNFNLSNKK